MTDKEKIISEIQRRINLFRKDGKLGSDTEIALYGLINFINSMQEEPVNEDLEEEWKRYITSEEYLKDIPGGLPVARHFVNWHKLQMIKSAKLSGWVARDENGSLHLFEVEPSRIMHRWLDRDYHSTTLDNKDFPDLEWEDEPVYVKLPIIVED